MRVLLLCDGGGSLGVGHVMRSLALAEAAVVAGHDVVVAGRFEGAFLAGQLAAVPVEVQSRPAVAEDDPQNLVELVRREGADVLHVDSYGASARLRELLGSPAAGAPAGTVVLSNMEDGTFGRRPADVVIDPTFGADLAPRPEDGSTWLLRGSRYTPLRQRVIDARGRTVDGTRPDEPGSEVGQVARSVLVVMGGTDPIGFAPHAVDLLARTGLRLAVTVIAVGENAERARAAAEGSLMSVTVLAPVDDLAALIATHDLVISAAGTSVWELCCIGVAAAVVWTVDNQREGYDRVVAAGAAIGLGGPELAGPGEGDRAADLLGAVLTDAKLRAGLVLAGRDIVDGLGAWRVVRTWESAGRQDLGTGALPGTADLVARPATLQDSRVLWAWRNDPVTRAGSRSAGEVPWADHLRWLTASLTMPDRILLMVEDPAGPVGTVRWDLAQELEAGVAHSHDWEVSVTVAPQRRGQSLGRPLLRAGEAALWELTRTSRTRATAYLAEVHTGNRASMRLFEASGYVPDLPPDARGFMRYRKAARVP